MIFFSEHIWVVKLVQNFHLVTIFIVQKFHIVGTSNISLCSMIFLKYGEITELD